MSKVKQTSGEALSSAAVLLALAILALWFAATTQLPSEADLTEVRGALRSYSCRGKSITPVCDLTLQDGTTFWTDALYKLEAEEIFRDKPVEIRAWAKDNKSYGLWINGREIRTNEYVLRRDYILVRLFFSLLALVGVGGAVVLYRSTKVQPSSGAAALKEPGSIFNRERMREGAGDKLCLLVAAALVGAPLFYFRASMVAHLGGTFATWTSVLVAVLGGLLVCRLSQRWFRGRRH